MKSKKFVLAWLVLLAITMVLLPLAGCKNDTVPPEVEKQEQGDGGGSETDKNNTAAKLVSISVTPPERTVYSVGQEFDPTGMVVTATYNAGEPKDVTSLARTNFDTVTAGKGLGKEVTVSYTEGETIKTTTFTVTVFPAEVEVLTDYESPNNTGNDCTYVAFGEWPQTEAVDFNPTTTPKSLGIFVDNYYVEGNDKYVKEGGKYYKVEPIVWRVLTTSYKAPEGGTVGEILLLAEKILTGGIKWADNSNDYMQSYIRKWLNGNSGTGKTSDYNGDAGFLQTAFIESAQNLIADTTVDNSADSTTDKIFLLSQQEATTESYGFATSSDSGEGSTRLRFPTDYAKATGAYQGDSTEGYGGWWWLRSPLYGYPNLARVINVDGDALNGGNLDFASGGVVPALSISLTEN